MAKQGESIRVICVEGCDKTGPVWGTDVYTADSAVCASAIHAGVIPATGGTFTLELVEGKPEYPGTNRNGVTSLKYAKYGLSFVVRKAQ